MAAVSARSSSHDRDTRARRLVDRDQRRRLGIDAVASPQEVLGDRQLRVGKEAGVGEVPAASHHGRAGIADDAALVPHEPPKTLGFPDGPRVQRVVVGRAGASPEGGEAGGVGPFGGRSPERSGVARSRGVQHGVNG